MRSVDTNILARFLIRDDAAQSAVADAIMGSDVLVTPTVLLETAWLLASRFRLSRAEVSDGLIAVLEMESVTIRDEQSVRWAVERMRNGADFADMIHLVVSRDAEHFVTFDRDLSRRAGEGSPVPIQTLAG